MSVLLVTTSSRKSNEFSRIWLNEEVKVKDKIVPVLN
jgi:hypothetical protein